MKKLNYGMTGKERKNLVNAISEILETPAVYLKVPTCAYQIGEYHVDRNGVLTGEENAELENKLKERGFEAIETTEETAAETETTETEEPTEEAETTEPTMEEPETETPETEPTKAEKPKRKKRKKADGTYTTTETPDAIEATEEPETETPKAEKPKRKKRKKADGTYTTTETSDAIEATEEPATEAESPETNAREAETDSFTIELPLEGLTSDKIENLCRMVEAKANLIKEAIGVDDYFCMDGFSKQPE